ncbi:hypothetical protein HanRHA438_Chr03g0112281 [Helianthus annuus]|nr:hypothetical protein HanRHA438_Chr03g0112281 [Helianthus annuus]
MKMCSLDSRHSPQKQQNSDSTGTFLFNKASLVGRLSFTARHATIPTFRGTQLFHRKAK